MLLKKKEIPKYIIDDIEIPSDSDRENSDEKTSDGKNSNKESSDEESSDEKNSDEENYFFSIYKNAKKYYRKTKKSFFLKKSKTKNANMLLSDIEIFLKKKKKRSVNIVVNDVRIF